MGNISEWTLEEISEELRQIGEVVFGDHPEAYPEALEICQLAIKTFKENEQLKKENEQLAHNVNFYCKSFSDTKDENEKLKEELYVKQLQKMVLSIIIKNFMRR